MTRFLLTASIALLPSVALAQVPVSVASGVGGFGGTYRPGTPSLTAPVGRPIFVPRMHTGMVGGFVPPAVSYPSFGFVGRGLFGYYGGFYGWGAGLYSYYDPAAFGPAAPAPEYDYNPPMRVIPLANVFPAVLTVDLPVAAKIWVNGSPAAGEKATEWVLTSSDLRSGQPFTFQVRARWEADGKTYEYTRDVTVAAGDRSRVRVVSGTPVSDKE